MDELFNCEDILMNFVVAAEAQRAQQPPSAAATAAALNQVATGRTAQPALWQAALNNRLRAAFGAGGDPGASGGSQASPVLLYVNPRCFLETGFLSGAGISSEPKHLDTRAACAQRFAAMLGSGLPRAQALGMTERNPEEQWAQEGKVWSTAAGNATAEAKLSSLCAWGGY